MLAVAGVVVGWVVRRRKEDGGEGKGWFGKKGEAGGPLPYERIMSNRAGLSSGVAKRGRRPWRKLMAWPKRGNGPNIFAGKMNREEGPKCVNGECKWAVEGLGGLEKAKWFAAGDEAMLPKNESSFASIDANQFGSTDLEISDSWVERELSAELPNSILPFAPMSAGFVHSPQWSPDWSTPGGHTHYRHPTTSTVQDSITPTSDTASPITSAKPSGPMNLVFLPIPPSSPDLSPPPPPPPSRQSITDSDDASSLGFASPSKDEASSRPAQPSSRPASSGIRSGKSSRDSSMSRRGDLRRAASIKAAVRRVLNDASEKGLYASNGATPDMGDMYDSDGASRRESADVASPTRTIVPEMGAKMWNTHPSPASPADTIVNDV